MSKQIKVRLHATIEIRVPHTTTIDYDEFREWYEENGDALHEIEADSLVEFIRASPDSEVEMNSRFPKADVDHHDILAFDIDEAEVLAVEP